MASWRDLLFAHWPLPAADLRHLVPSSLQLDLWSDEAWLGIVPFRMEGIRVRGLLPIPGLSSTPEINVRTYVIVNRKPGVYFFSLDASSRLAVRVARRFFHLPYFDARMGVRRDGDWIRYITSRDGQLFGARGVSRLLPRIRLDGGHNREPSTTG